MYDVCQNKGEKNTEFISAEKIDNLVDTMWYGDSFAGEWAYELLSGYGQYQKAARFDNAFGALRTQGEIFDVFKSLEEKKLLEKTIRN